MDKVFIHGVMEGGMMESTIWIKSMAMEFTTGQMEGDMKDFGQMENNMEKENIFCLME